MRKLSKVLSILLAMALIFTSASIGVQARDPYKDADINYDSIDQPSLSVTQYATMAMDEIDRMLMKENLSFEFNLLGMDIGGGFRTIDESLDTIESLMTTAASMASKIGGDIGGDPDKGLDGIDFSALVTVTSEPYSVTLACPHRDDAQDSDLQIFKALFQFLADNAEILAKLPKGSVENGGLDLGALSGFIDLGDKLNVPALAKKAIAKFMNAEYNAATSLDDYANEFLTQVLTGTYPKTGNSKIYWASQEIKYYLPDIMSKVNFLEDSVYDIIETCIRAALDSDKVMSFVNSTVQRWLHQFCGYAYVKTKDSNGKSIYTRDPANDKIKENYVALVNLDFTLESFNTSSWEENTTFVDHANDILGKIVEAAFKETTGITWEDENGNADLFANIRGAAEKVLEYTGNGLFASYVEVLPIATVKAMSNDQFVAYILRSIMNGSIDSVYITSDVDTTLGVLFETVRSLAGEVVPSENYDSKTVSLENMIKMGLDMAAAGLRGYTSIDIDYDDIEDTADFVDQAMEWVIDKYGGFVADLDGTGWTAVNDVFFHIIPADWLPYDSEEALRDNIESIVFDDIVDNILNFDLPAILSLFSRNPDGELNGTIVDVLMARVTEIINYVIGEGAFPEQTYECLDDILDTGFLSSLIEGLLTTLYGEDGARFDSLAPSLLEVVCAALGLSSAEEFGYPYVSLSDITVISPDLTNTFYMYNGSSGINTAWTNKQGTETTQDALYLYEINSITVENDNGDEISVETTDTQSAPDGVRINGGESRSFTFTGDLSAAVDTILTVTISYDVYGETGQKMTTAPLTTTNYVYVSSLVDDADMDHEFAKVDTGAANQHVLYRNIARYLKVGNKVSDIADIEAEIRRVVPKNTGGASASAHQQDSTVTVAKIDVDAGLTALGVASNAGTVIKTNKNGGSFKFKPYKYTGASDAKLEEEGRYQNTFTITATATETAAEKFVTDQFIVVYNDYNLASYLNSAVKADRQQANFKTGNVTGVKYIPFDRLGDIPEKATAEQLDALKITTTVNGTQAWEDYMQAVKEAAALIYAPRVNGSFLEDVASNFESAAEFLYNATQELEGCSASSGADGVKTALNEIVPDDNIIPVLDENGVQKTDKEGNLIFKRVDFDDIRYTYFAREDYVSYTYTRFKPERRAAERLINRDRDLKNGKDVEPISAIEAVYAIHRLNLYADRLIRVRAYKEHLASAITKFTALRNTNNSAGKYSTESWNDFVKAYNFATTVNGESIGTTYANSENLKTSGLRQSRVNEARGQLIKAAKKLSVDFDELEKLLKDNKALFDSDGSTYTAVSFQAFKSAYTSAKAVFDNKSSTQKQVDDAYNALSTKISQLVKIGGGEEIITFVEIEGVQPKLIEESENTENKFMVGLFTDWLDSLDDFIEMADGYTYELIGNEAEDLYTTGASLVIYDADENEVATYMLVMFGDVDGNGEVQMDDAIMLISVNAKEYVGEWQLCSDTDEYAESLAADVIHDNEITNEDAIAIISECYKVDKLNQYWTCSDDENTL